MINYLQVERLTKSYGDRLLFDEINFTIAQGDKVGLIAPNGTGKSTLLRILSGREDEDSGNITYRNDLRIGFLEQEPHFTPGQTIAEAMDCMPDSEAELKAKQLLGKLRIEDTTQLVDTLSGGQLKRVALARVLAHEPDLLFMDEPTNHLDLEMTEWLEGYLSRGTLSLLMVTHDRYFLDRVCNRILEIDQRQLYSYQGNYSYYLAKRQERIDAFQAESEKAANLYRKELDWMRRQPQARATKAKYRIDSFYTLEERTKQRRDDSSVNLDVKAAYIGNKIFSAEHVSKRFGDRIIVNDYTYEFARYEKMGIVGDNGTGKTTFIRMLLGEIAPDSGHFDIGQTIRFGYYSQAGAELDENKKVIDVVREIAEEADMGDGRKLGVSQFLQHFLFTPERQYSYVGQLSGGERRRLNLCMVLMGNPNFLVMDEPTNDLDIMTLNILEQYLCDFKGCVIVVSHDRYFMDKVVDHLLVFKGQGVLQDFPGNYTQHRDWQEAVEREAKVSEGAQASQRQQRDVRRDQTQPVKRKLTYKEQKELEAIEAELPLLEEEKIQIETLLSSGTLDTDAVISQSARYAELVDMIDEKTMRWLELND
ncbi:ABC-F family ATP-binding cassette domain-containing protein [Parabacteroides sp. OttesenSCG-928-G07]|nr:ABC-F family ATP-binding cassette domain-containing protein [Parabacteroides sp. OttesenSCG-928-G07]